MTFTAEIVDCGKDCDGVERVGVRVLEDGARFAFFTLPPSAIPAVADALLGALMARHHAPVAVEPDPEVA